MLSNIIKCSKTLHPRSSIEKKIMKEKETGNGPLITNYPKMGHSLFTLLNCQTVLPTSLILIVHECGR